MYHSPQEVAGGSCQVEVLIPSHTRSFDVLDTRRECMSTRAQSPMMETLLNFLLRELRGRDGSGQVHDTESVMSQLGERIFSELSGFDLVLVSPIPYAYVLE